MAPVASPLDINFVVGWKLRDVLPCNAFRFEFKEGSKVDSRPIAMKLRLMHFKFLHL